MISGGAITPARPSPARLRNTSVAIDERGCAQPVGIGFLPIMSDGTWDAFTGLPPAIHEAVVRALYLRALLFRQFRRRILTR